MTTELQSPSLINDFADFLAKRPSGSEIVAWSPSEAVVDRYQELAERCKEGVVSEEEQRELESFLNSEIVLSLLKARLRSAVRPASVDPCRIAAARSYPSWRQVRTLFET